MHDIRAIRDNPDAFRLGWKRRGSSADVDQILALDAQLRAAQTAGQAAQAERNDASKKIGEAKRAKDEAAATALMSKVEALKATLEEQAAIEKAAKVELDALLAALPNLPADDVPVGADETENVEVRRWGTPFAISTPKDHVDLGTALGLMDFEAAARMSGSRFVVLKGQLARLERALGQFMLDMQTVEHGYVEVSPPLLVRDNAVFGTGQLPKFEQDLFKAEYNDQPKVRALFAQASNESFQKLRSDLGATESIFSGLLDEQGQFVDRLVMGEFAEKYYLIPTAEVSLTNLVREQITPEEELPLRLTALTPCFRSEAGASGRDTRGMIRQHQFYKCELVSIATPDQSEAEHEHMIQSAEKVLKAFDLPFRTMKLCAGDMGFSARKTYDLEVWIPSEGRYREISSISNCGDFQARRMDARTKKAGEKGTRYVHTLNGSGLAVGRTLVAILENYQDENGRIAIPQPLHPYMRGLTHIGGEG